MARETKHVRELVALADELGWELSWTRKNHLVFQKEGRPPVYTAGTPSDWRATKNLVARLIRIEAEANA